MPPMQPTGAERAGRSLLLVAFLGAWLSPITLRSQINEEPTPVLSADVNGVRSAQVFSGWPFMLRLRVMHSQLFATNAAPITLAAAMGDWTTLLRVDVLDANGTSVAWPLMLLNTPEATLPLDSITLGELYWVLAPQQTATLLAGTYRVLVTLDSLSSAAPQGWRGRTQTIPLDIHLASEPAALTSSQLEEKHRLMAEYLLAVGQPAEAMAQIGILLQADPTNIGGLSYRGGILGQLGRFSEALASTQLALAQVAARYPNATEPPRELLAQQSLLTELLLPGRINSIAAVNGNILLDWNAIPGSLYSVESSPDLTNWAIRATGLLAETNVLNWITERLSGPEFFRLSQ